MLEITFNKQFFSYVFKNVRPWQTDQPQFNCVAFSCEALSQLRWRKCLQKVGAVFTMLKYSEQNKIVAAIPCNSRTSHCITFTVRNETSKTRRSSYSMFWYTNFYKREMDLLKKQMFNIMKVNVWRRFSTFPAN